MPFITRCRFSNQCIGPSLDQIRPVAERVKNAVVNGIGVMPSAMGVLSEEEIDAVSYYVSKVTNN